MAEPKDAQRKRARDNSKSIHSNQSPLSSLIEEIRRSRLPCIQAEQANLLLASFVR